MSSTATSKYFAAVGFAALAVLSLAGTTGCGEKKFKGAMILSGQKVSSEKLEHFIGPIPSVPEPRSRHFTPAANCRRLQGQR